MDDTTTIGIEEAKAAVRTLRAETWCMDYELEGYYKQPTTWKVYSRNNGEWEILARFMNLNTHFNRSCECMVHLRYNGKWETRIKESIQYDSLEDAIKGIHTEMNIMKHGYEQLIQDLRDMEDCIRKHMGNEFNIMKSHWEIKDTEYRLTSPTNPKKIWVEVKIIKGKFKKPEGWKVVLVKSSMPLEITPDMAAQFTTHMQRDAVKKAMKEV